METMHAEPLRVAARPGPQPSSDQAQMANSRLVEGLDRIEATVSHLEDRLAAAMRPEDPGRISPSRDRADTSQVGHLLHNAADRVEDLHARVATIIDRIDLP